MPVPDADTTGRGARSTKRTATTLTLTEEAFSWKKAAAR